MHDVDSITIFLKTGKLSDSSQLSEANQKELMQAAQRYYIESQFMNYYYSKSLL